MNSLGDTFWLALSYQMDARDLEAVPQTVLCPCKCSSTFLSLTYINTKERRSPPIMRCLNIVEKQDLVIRMGSPTELNFSVALGTWCVCLICYLHRRALNGRKGSWRLDARKDSLREKRGKSYSSLFGEDVKAVPCF